ncbi:MAG: PEP-CTERM sorting domain-containing protein [Lacipirellulaceae bacterium]
MPFRTLLLAVITLAIFSAPTHAALVERDFLVPGDGLLIYDTVNRREWLDLAVTERVDLTGLAAALAPGAPLEGFTVATLADVSLIANSAGVNWVDEDPGVKASYEPANRWMDKLEDSHGDVLSHFREKLHLTETGGFDYRLHDHWFGDDIDGDGNYPPTGFQGRDPGRVPDLIGGIIIDFDDLVWLPYPKELYFAQDTAGNTIVESRPKNGLRISYGLARNADLSGQELTLDNASIVYLSTQQKFSAPGVGGISATTAFTPSELIGPYWLTRVAVPEPSALVLLLSSSFVIVTRRKRS